MTRKTNSATTTVYLIYDGDCILCKNSAQAMKIKKSIGNLEIINARELHPLVKEAMKKGYDLNKGILVKYNHQYFYGAAAVNFL
ncbi:TPA: DCC1-like thiol-disulfide oxidoreductase family protein, partial [Legionella pneumophila]